MPNEIIQQCRHAFSQTIANFDPAMSEVFDDFSSEQPTDESQADHNFGGYAPQLIDQLVSVWREIYPYISATSDVGGVAAIISMVRSRKSDVELISALKKIEERLGEIASKDADKQ
jgi:hypothetical protein